MNQSYIYNMSDEVVLLVKPNMTPKQRQLI